LDFWLITTDSFRLMRRTGAVWRLALISAIQVLLYTVIILGVIAPMGVLTQLAVATGSGGDPNTLGSGANAVEFATAVSNGVRWVGTNWVPLVAGIVVLTLAWAASGVFDVAATAGIITQTNASRDGRPTSAATGIRDGFRIWWRTVGLLAIAALPSLVYLLAIAVYTFTAVSLPLYQGRLPQAPNLSGGAVSTPFSALISLFGIPLSVLVALGLRFAVLEDCEWRQAFVRAWRLTRARLVDVTLMYLMIVVITLAAVIGVSVVAAFVFTVGGIGVGLILAGGGALSSAPVVALGIIGSVALGVLLLALAIVTLAWQSVAWTLFWRRATGAEQPVSGGPSQFRPAVGPTIGV
jgi:hypothetical protein